MKVYHKVVDLLDVPGDISCLKDSLELYENRKHCCVVDFDFPDDESTNMLYGNAIDKCYEEENKLFVDNDEYKNRVLFCPFCGGSL